jgi:hypothetical protein
MAPRAAYRCGLAGLNRIGCGNDCIIRSIVLGRVEAGKVSGCLEQRIVTQRPDHVIHCAFTASASLVGLQLEVQVGWALTGKMWHAGTFTNAIRAMTTGTGRFYDALTFRNILRVCIQGSHLRTVVGIDSRLSERALETGSSEEHAGNGPHGGQARATKASTHLSEKNLEACLAPVQRSCVD